MSQMSCIDLRAALLLAAHISVCMQSYYRICCISLTLLAPSIELLQKEDYSLLVVQLQMQRTGLLIHLRENFQESEEHRSRRMKAEGGEKSSELLWWQCEVYDSSLMHVTGRNVASKATTQSSRLSDGPINLEAVVVLSGACSEIVKSTAMLMCYIIFQIVLPVSHFIGAWPDVDHFLPPETIVRFLRSGAVWLTSCMQQASTL